MNGLRSLASRTPSSIQAQLAATATRNTTYRRLSSQVRALNLRNPTSSSICRSLPLALQSPFLPRSLRVNPTIYSRNFHHGPSLAKKTQKAAAEKAAKKQKPVAEEAVSSSQSPKEETKESGEESKAGEQEPKTEGEEETKGKKKEEKKEEAPPPPPNGDKSPWQVFKETLKTEIKESKEWNDSTKALAGEVDKFAESERVRKLREAAAAGSNVVADTTSKVFKTTAGVVGKGAAWTWETPAVKVARKSANATGKIMAEVTRPIRESESFKTVKNVIDDGSSSKYGGWVEKEERRKARERRELDENGGVVGKKAEPAEEDPDAGTNVTLHKDAAWKESWRDFRDSSKFMQGIFSMKSAYNESENPFISTARNFSDRIAGFFAENETAMVIKKIREMDPAFQMEPFLRDMREYILPEVLDAYVKGDIETLRLWLSAAQFSVYDALSKQYTTAGLKSDGRILDIRAVEIMSARILEPGDVPVFIVTCKTQEVHVYRNAKTNDLAAGMEDRVQLVTYAIGITRIAEDVSNPETRGWRLIELQKSGKDWM